MATIENTYTGDGSTTNYTFTFEYLEQADVKVTLNGTATSAFTFANATTISFNTAPGAGVAIRIYRDTDVDILKATFFPGSAIKAEDLNNNFTQNNFSAQESKASAGQAPAALANSLAAITTANQASVDASTALAAVSAAVAYTPVANVASIPGSPVDGDYIEILNSTGIEGFSPLAGLPVGFVGDSELSVRLNYTSSGSTWNWVDYSVNDTDARYLKQTDAASTYLTQANGLETADIGTTVQAYDADTAKLDVAQTFTAQQTFGELKETVFTLGTTGSIALDPANGSIQSSVLTGDPTFTDSLEAGQTIVLMLENGASYVVTWPTITWVTSGGNVAPTLTAKDTLVFWKVSTTLYGAYVGSYV
jgi:hypothetical protein